MRTIPLTQGQFAAVDDDDFERLACYNWHVVWSRGQPEAVTQLWDGQRCHSIRMSRIVLEAPDDVLVDHVDGDKLNNRKMNLRLATNSQNMANSGKRTLRGRKPTSRYKGVSWDVQTGKWRVVITINYRVIHVGRFLIEDEAAKAYNAAAVKYFGEFAYLNDV